MAKCSQCHEEKPLNNGWLCIRCSTYTVLTFCCVECLIQYYDDKNNVYIKDAEDLLQRYLNIKRET